MKKCVFNIDGQPCGCTIGTKIRSIPDAPWMGVNLFCDCCATRDKYIGCCLKRVNNVRAKMQALGYGSKVSKRKRKRKK